MKTRRPPRAFTLVELLVAMVVLTLLSIVVLQVINFMAQAISMSNRTVDAATQARLTFDRIGRDLDNLVKRPDNVFLVTPAGPNVLMFVTGVNSTAPTGSAAGTNRGTSVIAYQVATSANNAGRLCLQRGARALLWTDTGFAGLDSSGLPVTIPTTLQPASTDFDVLSSGVIRLAVGFQLYPDNNSVTLADGTSVANARGQIVYSAPLRSDTGTAKDVDVTRISSVVIGVVAIDLNSLKLLSASQVSDLAGAFPAITTSLPLNSWASVAANASSLPTTVPLPARQAVRAYQRIFPITSFASKASQ